MCISRQPQLAPVPPGRFHARAKPCSLLLIDSQDLFLSSLLQALIKIPAIQVLECAPLTSMKSLAGLKPEAVVMDPYTGGTFWLDTVRSARQLWPLSRLIILSEYFDANSTAAALSWGAQAYILKSEPAEAIRAGIEFVCRGGAAFSSPIVAALTARQFSAPILSVLPEPGGRDLTPKETDVLQLVARGLTDVEIGARMGISARTAERHMTNILNKLGCRNRSQAVAQMIERMPAMTPKKR